MALLDLGQFPDRGIEGRQCLFRGVGQFDLDESHMFKPKFGRVDDGPEAEDVAVGLQPFQAHLAGGFRESDTSGQFGDRQAAVLRQNRQNLPVVAV